MFIASNTPPRRFLPILFSLLQVDTRQFIELPPTLCMIWSIGYFFFRELWHCRQVFHLLLVFIAWDGNGGQVDCQVEPDYLPVRDVFLPLLDVAEELGL